MIAAVSLLRFLVLELIKIKRVVFVLHEALPDTTEAAEFLGC